MHTYIWKVPRRMNTEWFSNQFKRVAGSTHEKENKDRLKLGIYLDEAQVELWE